MKRALLAYAATGCALAGVRRLFNDNGRLELPAAIVALIRAIQYAWPISNRRSRRV